MLMISASSISIYYISRVKSELDQIAFHLVPITEKLTQIDMHALRQEISLERIFTYLDMDQIPLNKVKEEETKFKIYGNSVEAEFAEAKKLVQEGLRHSSTSDDIREFSRLEPFLEILEREHQILEGHGLKIIEALKKENHEQAHLLEGWLVEAEDDFNAGLLRCLETLERITERSALNAEEHENLLIILNWTATGFAIVLGLLFSAIISSRIVRPLKDLVAATKKVEEGHLDANFAVQSKDEIGTMADQFNQMLDGIRKKERVKATFGQYVDPRILNSIINSYNLEESHREPVTVFFSDIAGFSRISEQFTPAVTVKLVNEYLSLVSEPIVNRQGVIDKFIGDAVVAFWSPPFVSPEEGALLSCHAALEQQRQIDIFRNKVSEITGIRKDLPEISVRMGIASSECVVGNIGSTNSKSFTAIGPATEWAETLETLNKKYKTEILVSEPIVELVNSQMEFRRLETVEIVAGKKVNVYELLGPAGGVPLEVIEYKNDYEQALDNLELGDVKNASLQFIACKKKNANDGAVDLHLQSIMENEVA